MQTNERTDAAAYLILGFCHVWVLVIQWGYATFPGNVASAAALGGAVTLILVAGPLALFARRPAAFIALVAVAAETCAAGIVFVQPGSPRGLLLLAAIPLVAVSWAAIRAISHSATDGPSLAGEHPFVTAALIVVAYAMFFIVFDGATLLALLTHWSAPMAGLRGLNVVPTVVGPVVQEVTATSRYQDLEEYDARRAFDGNPTTSWAANGSHPARLVARFNVPGTLAGVILLARETSLLEGWQSVQADLYLTGQHQRTVRLRLPTAATQSRQAVEWPPTLVDSVQLSFEQPVLTLLNGATVDPLVLNPGYTEIKFVWNP